MRTTSIDAYNAIKNNGYLSKTRFAVYNALFEKGPLTGAEVDDLLKKDGGRGHYHKRLSELLEFGVAKNCGERVCAVTGHTAVTWDVTETVPTSKLKPKLRKRPSKNDMVAASEFSKYLMFAMKQKGVDVPDGYKHVMKWVAEMGGTHESQT